MTFDGSELLRSLRVREKRQAELVELTRKQIAELEAFQKSLKK